MPRPCRDHTVQPAASAPGKQPVPVVGEPAMRRWPHPVAPPAVPSSEGLLHVLQRQTELLAEIRTLLSLLASGQTRQE